MPVSNDPVQDRETVTPAGETTGRLPAGVVRRDVVTHIDERGSVVELFDPRWNPQGAPLVYSYAFTVRPGFVKGWGMHKLHEDRYFILSGEIQVVLFDERDHSPTRGLVSTVTLSDYRRGLLNIPAGIWHASQNLGSIDALVVNFPTNLYDHANPDKYRLPLDNDRIPFKFASARGW